MAQILVQFYGGDLSDSLDAAAAALPGLTRGEYSPRRQGFPFSVAFALYGPDRLDEAFEAFQTADREATRTGATAGYAAQNSCSPCWSS
jgi:hypothetical protein